MILFKKNINVFFLLFTLSLFIKLIILSVYKFDGFYGQDSYAYYDYSKSFIDSVNNFSLPPNFYFPVGFYLLTYIFNILTFGNTSIASLCVSLISNSLIPPVTFLLSYELIKNYFDERETRLISILSGILLCFSGSFIQAGIVIMSDSPGLFLALTSLYFLIKYSDTNKLIYSVLSFSFLSFSIITRYINVLFIPLFILAIIMQYKSLKKVNYKHLILSLLIASVISLPQMYYIFKYGISYLRPEEGSGQWTTQWSLLNFFRKDFFIADGSFRYSLMNSIYYAAVIFHPMNFLIFGVFFFTGTYFIMINWYRSIFLYLILWILIFYIFLAGMPLQVSRYTLVYFPPVAVISSIGFFKMKVIYPYRKIIFAFLLLILFSSGMYRINNFIGQKNRDLKVVEYVNNNLKRNSTLFSFFITGTINHYSPKKSLEMYYYNSSRIKEIIDSSGTDVYFIIPENVIINQWRGLTLEQTFNFVKANYNPVKINEFDIYSVYCIKKL